MNFGDYPTPGDVTIYIGNAWVDDAYRVDYNEQNAKVPLTGYHQKHYSMVADGKLLIVGNVIIHYRFPGYLTYAIKNALHHRESTALETTRVQGTYREIAPPTGAAGTLPVTFSGPATPTRVAYQVSTKDTVLQSINAIRRMTPAERVQSLLASHERGFFRSQSALLNSLYGTSPERGDEALRREDPFESPAEMSPFDYVNGEHGIDLRLYYGYVGLRDQGVYVTEVLKGVHFTGRRKVVNASTAGGDLSASGQSLLEVYPFFARSVTPLVDDKPPDFLGVT